ncbi:hypothetical protein P152DRAFT_369325, partial [Eremomyces bilateralis CBS 781.70]
DELKIMPSGVGCIKINTNQKGKCIPMILSDVLYIPEIKVNLISISQLLKRGYNIKFSKKGAEISYHNSRYSAIPKNGLYI